MTNQGMLGLSLWIGPCIVQHISLIYKAFGYFGKFKLQSYITDRWIIEDVPDGH